MSFKWPRRASIPHLTKAELSIRAATHTVEEAGCDVLLTEAVMFLEQARNKVADYVDKQCPDNAQVTIETSDKSTQTRNCIYAHTDPTTPNYPQFISVNTEKDRVELTTRSAAWGDGTCGPTSTVVLTRQQARELGEKLLRL